MISRIMANYIRPFRMLLLGTLCLFCLDTFAQNTVVKRQPVSKKVTKKKEMVKKKVKVEEVQSTTQAVQQFEMPTVVDCCQLQSAPSEYNCPNEDVRKEDVVTVGGRICIASALWLVTSLLRVTQLECISLCKTKVFNHRLLIRIRVNYIG